MTRFLYFHGFSSGFDPTTSKVVTLETLAPVSGLTTNYFNPCSVESIAFWIESALANEDNIILVGTSLGGYFARYFSKKYNLRCILINPSINPYDTIPPGNYVNYITGKDNVVISSDVERLREYKAETQADCLTILATDDEVIDYRVAFEALKNNTKIVLTSGGHRLNDLNKVLDEIQDFINFIPAHDTR